jgi:hypothetical protein
MAEAAAANGIPKKIIPHNVAQYTADAVQNPVRPGFLGFVLFFWEVGLHLLMIYRQHNFYTEFQPEFDLIVEESNGRVLQ